MAQSGRLVDTSDLKPEWLESCLRRHFNLPPGAVKEIVVVESFDSCSARNTRLKVQYTPEADGPEHLMLRHSGDRGGLNEREVRFYNEVAPQSPQTPTVPCYDVAWDDAPPRWHVLLLDVSPLSIGVETGGGVMTALIPRNTTIPTEASEVFTTSVDGQNFVPIHVLQGERAMAIDCRSLAEFELTGIPPAPRGVPKIQVTFYVDANGILNVEATDLGTGMTTEVSITPHSGLSQDEIEDLVVAADAHYQADAQRSELAELHNQADTLLYTTEQALEGYGDLIEDTLLAQVQADSDELRNLVEGDADFETIRAAYAQLEGAAFRIAESMYDFEP